MLTLELTEKETIRITHDGEDLYLEFKKLRIKGGTKYKLNIIGPQSFQVKREKLEANG